MKRSFGGSVVLISGAAGGLGRALAQRFGRAGSRLLLLDLDATAVEALASELAAAGVESHSLTCDVTDEAACIEAIDSGVAHFGRLDALVNNAGITHRSAFEVTQTAVLRKVVDVNLFGAIHLTRAALPHLKRTHGLVITLSSVAGFAPLIARTGYAASKHALHGFFDSLRSELAPAGVGVMLVCPAFIDTGIDRHALGPTGGAALHAQVVVGRRLQPGNVADRIVRAAERDRRLLLIGRTAHAAWWISRISPGFYERIMARRLRGELV